ncbi:hypothetical protein OS493_025853 [Desmophyllum pertusum]|uniref:Uncharacterized protein n=1 Tax=Desmophyllum pertusum TaxID=174260 RepID=A0A9W9YXW5_9CNID|nr:hypothetical protein OS493_025853 [Desmophyllum pertusum]
MQIRDGQKSQSKELELLHGDDKYDDITNVYSTGRYMWVKFRSISGRWETMEAGFKAHFKAVDPPVGSKYLCFLGNIYNNNLTLNWLKWKLYKVPLRTTGIPHV